VFPDEHCHLGHVANKMFFNGGNEVAVTLKDGAVWTVTGSSAITSLTIGEGCKVAVPKGYKMTMTVDGIKKPVKAGTYSGKIVINVVKG
jgi:hypothetical protein